MRFSHLTVAANAFSMAVSVAGLAVIVRDFGTLGISASDAFDGLLFLAVIFFSADVIVRFFREKRP